MKVSTVLTIPANLFVMVLSIVTSSLGVVILAGHEFDIALLLFVIGGYASAILSTIPIILRRIQTPLYFIFLLMTYIFQIVTGIIFCINIIQHKITFSTGQKHWDVTIATIFIINVFSMAISITLFSILCLLEPEETNPDEEKITISLIQSLCNTHVSRPYLNQEEKVPQFLSINKDPRISKKTSDQTLVEIPLYDTVVRNKINNVGEENLPYMIQYSPNNQMESSDHLYYTDNNWMDSSAVVNSMKYSTELNGSPSPDTTVKTLPKKSSFSLFGFNARHNESTRNNNLEKSSTLRGLKSSQSVPNLIKSDTLKGIVMAQNSSLKMKPSSLNIQAEVCKRNLDIKKLRKVSLIEPILEQIHTPEKEEREVKRSKSTSYINGVSPKKMDWIQRRKSIHDEKSFLQHVNESLLPAVLKTGESPIVGLKRQQQEIIDKNADDYINDPLSKKTTNKCKKTLKNLTTELSPVGETGLSESSNVDQIEDSVEHSDFINLPFISEFDEPIDQEKFSGFDQDTALVMEEYPTAFTQTPKKKGSYIFKDVNYDIPLSQSGQNRQAEAETSPEDYSKSLSGLEKIPKTSSYSSILWNQDTNRKNTPTSMKHISLKDWDENSEKWNEHRTRSGANLNIAGITRLLSDHNLRSMNTERNDSAQKEMKEEYLLPPLDTRLDNIDDLSDLHSATGSTNGNRKSNSFLSINRSSSAPSLHTYRDLYPTEADSRSSLEHSYSNEEENNSIKYLQNTLQHIATPTEAQVGSTASSSPIRKFFQESPKRLNVMLKRKSTNKRYSFDLNSLKDPQTVPFHKHSGSTISNQISLYSYKSSKSNSPRKSLRALLRSPSKQSPSKQPSPTTSAPSFAELSRSKQANMLNNNDDDCLLHMTENALSFWDLETAQSSDRSRVSSVPSAVIGEYDREKWRTLKALQNQEKVTFDKVESIQ